ncbi:MAG: MATE family efflux transporter [Turicibacter sp.]
MKHIAGKIREDREFYKRLFILTLPIVLQSLITSSLNMLDTLMIGSIGELELAAVGVANQFYFLYSLIIMGMGAGCSIVIAQLWGKKDKESIKVVMRIGIMVATGLSIVFTLVGLLFSESIISIFNPDVNVIRIGAQYLRISVFSYFVTAISFVYAGALRSIGNSILPMWGSFIGLLVNAFLNTLLIFGLLGFPTLGVVGAAIATLIARIVECLIIVSVVSFRVEPLKLKVTELFHINRSVAKALYLTTLPVILNEACWGFANITYSIIYGRIGVEAIATTQITSTVLNLFMIVTFGLAHGSVVVIGNEIGANNEKQAIEYSKKIIRVSIIVAIIIALFLFLISPTVVNMYNVSQGVKDDAMKILIIYALFMVFRIYNAILIVGILRGGGDATYGSIAQGLTMWLVGIPLAFIGAFVLYLPIYAVVFLAALEEILKLFILRRRFKSNRWINNMVKDM